MAEYSYLKPKVKVGNLGEKKREHGKFVNVSSYMKYAGFNSADKLPGQEPQLILEKGPSADSGKPI